MLNLDLACIKLYLKDKPEEHCMIPWTTGYLCQALRQAGEEKRMQHFGRVVVGDVSDWRSRML